MEKPTTPPLIGDVNRSGGIFGTSILALALVLIFIALRFVTRIWLVKRVGWDDWCIVFAGVGLESPFEANTRPLRSPVWPHHWHGPNRCLSGSRFRATILLPYGS